jgi:low affinity Fe/Cu permease
MQHASHIVKHPHGQSPPATVPKGLREPFHHFAHVVAQAAGSVWAFVIALAVILIWAVTGPIFNFSDTWQLVINTATTIVTFLMVFLIQNTQNRDTRAMHLKIDELLRAIGEARTGLVSLEKLSEVELEALEAEFDRVRKRACTTPNEQIPQAEAST